MIGAGGLFLVGSALVALMAGDPFLKPKELIGASANPQALTILWQFRAPRVVLATLVGAGLAVSGASLQAFFRNPLADPFILGVASGGALGAAGALLLHLSPGMGSLCGFVGALAAAFTVYRLGAVHGVLRTDTVLLAGVALNALLSSLLSFILYLNAHRLMISAVYAWLMGGFQMATWKDIRFLIPYWALGIVISLYHSRALNALLMGEEWAHYSGVDLTKVRRWILAGAALGAGSCVSVSGVIGFVGLVGPHMARLLIGPDHRLVIPMSCIIGALILLYCDMFSRLIVRPAELPVGLFTAFLGVPFFLFLLRRTRVVYG